MPIVGRAKTDFLLLCIMKNGRQIRTQLTEKRLKLDSSSLYYEIAPTGPVPAPAVSSSSHVQGHVGIFEGKTKHDFIYRVCVCGARVRCSHVILEITVHLLIPVSR